MKNADIIFAESCKLMEKGIIGTTGRYVVVEDAEGNQKKLMEPEPIHTYAVWKSLGYQVKKGEKNIAAITIWKRGKSKKATNEEEGGEEGAKGERVFLKTAFFFKASQCERIAAV